MKKTNGYDTKVWCKECRKPIVKDFLWVLLHLDEMPFLCEKCKNKK